MIRIVGCLITSLTVSSFIFPILIKYSKRKRIFDEPGKRRIHKRLTPSIGGVAIFLGFFTSCVVWGDLIAWDQLKTLLGILSISFVLGLSDDLVHLKPIVKILGQLIAGSLAFFLVDIKIHSFSGFMIEGELDLWASYALTIMTMIIITNAYNLIDGIDGLAGAVAALITAFLGSWFYLTGDLNFALICFCILGSILSFLIFNWEPSKIFMGDTGALVIGMLISIITIRFIDLNYGLPFSSDFKFHATVPTAISLLCIPLLDTARIIIIRLSKGISPLKADKRHIHHALVRLGLTHASSTFLLLAYNIIVIAGLVFLREFSDWYVLGYAVFVSTIFISSLHFFLGRIIRPQDNS
jgi:UDP-GlcNAc:undecaprenyl-phosphate/decaprenyl-phosphate GlcNAc-1-phosphate transferase